MAQDYLSTDPNAGEETPKYLSTDPNAGNGGTPISDTATAAPARSYPSTGDLLRTAVNSKFPYIHPFDTASAMIAPIQHYTPEGRAEHPFLSRAGDVATNAQELNRIVGPEIGLLSAKDLPESLGAIGDSGLQLVKGAWDEIPSMARRAVMNGQGNVRLPIQVASPGRAAVLEKIFTPTINTGKSAVSAPDLGEFMANGYEASPTQGEIYEQRAQDLMRRGREQGMLDRAAARKPSRIASPPVKWTDAPEARSAPPPPIKWPERIETPNAPSPPVKWTAPAATEAPRRIPTPPVKWTGGAPARISTEQPGLTSPEGEGLIGSNGVERQVQTLMQKSILTPEEQAFVEKSLGPDARMRPGEGMSKWRQRITGGFKAARARTEP